ncbi:hypothetical protein E4T56_gene10726 [Termitomyces sp. T112]|nr:hypothetical protein E4T56_gene10726 [Termitomyces sp. T112]
MLPKSSNLAVKIETEWVHNAIEHVMAVSEDMPSMKDALSGDEKEDWSTAIDAELSQIEKLRIWEIVEVPTDANIISCRLDSSLKSLNNNLGSIIPKRSLQLYASPHFAFSSPLQHHAENEIIFMQFPPHYRQFHDLPPEFAKLPDLKLACQLERPLYGTKQGVHHWYEEVFSTFTNLGYTAYQADVTVFYKVNGKDYTIVAVATNDFTIIGNSTKTTSLIKEQLSKRFEIADLGPIN